MAEVMGIEQEAPGKSAASGDMLCRMRLWNRPVMGIVENGKARKMEVVPGGSYRFDDGTGKYLYAETVTFRPFLQRYRYSRWIPYSTPDGKGRKGRFVKTVFASDYKLFTSSDLMDEDGGFNCGRPSKYIQDWEALPEDTRRMISSVKRVRAVFGTVVLENALDEKGENVTSDAVAVPVIWEIENNKAFKTIGDVLQKYGAAGHIFPQHELVLSSEGAPMANGNMLYQPIAELDLTKNIEISQKEDTETFNTFSTWVKNHNKYIAETYESKAINNPTSEDQEVIDSFITVEDA
tara:strand:- start:4948 stop:5826 length:879 start_codon:yes stop_codon:yes gene_type:complete